MTYILTADTAHQVQMPLIINSSVYVNHVTNSTPNPAMPSMTERRVFDVSDFTFAVRKNAHTAITAYPNRPTDGTGMTPNR
jgi:hypothetical protein